MMQGKRVYDIKIAIERLKNYCALQDRCQWDVIQKMREWELMQMTQDHILEILISENFVDEKRFAESFCRGKFRIKKWGKRKIANELKKKQISKICIEIGLKEIEEEEYIEVLENLYHQKKHKTKDKNHFIRNRKIANFLLQRGFESELIWNTINKDK